MRKVITNNVIASNDDSLMTNFLNTRMVTQFNDSRENPSLHAYKVGHPNGKVNVPGKRGWIYMQRMLPNGASTVLQCFVPTNKTAVNRVKFIAGQSISPRRTNDTNPTYWIYDGIPPSTPMHHASSGDAGACTGFYINQFAGDPGYPGPGGPIFGIPNGYYPNTGGGCDLHGAVARGLGWTANTGSLVDCGQALCPIPPGTPLGGLDYTDPSTVDGFSDSNPSTTPTVSTQMPVIATDRELWDDGEFVRRWDKLNQQWNIVGGPNAGIYQDTTASVDILKGQLIYELLGTTTTPLRSVGVADKTNPACYGTVLGVAAADAVAGKRLPIQSSGNVYVPLNTFDLASIPQGTPLYLDVTGAFTTSPATAGSGEIFQSVGITGATNEYTLILGLPIVRQS